MNSLSKALWYIESHFTGELTLDEIASVAGVSRFHLSRAFGELVGCSITRYVRGRRLTVAAKALAQGAADILSVALDAGYGSHEAFTRAFRDQFGMTPEAVRAARTLDQLAVVEPFVMNQTASVDVLEPRFVDAADLLIAGLSVRYDYETCGRGIPAQWQRFAPYVGTVPGQIDATTFGVRYNNDHAGLDYLCGVQVSTFARLPAELSHIRIPARRYAVFVHRGHVANIRQSWSAIWSDWLPQSGHELADAPDFERYDQRFDPRTGNGEMEIWLPLKR